MRQFVPAESVEEQWDMAGLETALANDWQLALALQGSGQGASAITDEDIVEKVLAAANAAFDAKVEQVGGENFTQFERMVLLQSIDTHWREHLSALDYLRQGIHLRGYAQKQPKQEYKREAFELFGQLLDSVKNEVTKVLMTVRSQSATRSQAAQRHGSSRRGHRQRHLHGSDRNRRGRGHARRRHRGARPVHRHAMPAGQVPRVGRNDPCPCGSGKKYKQCHGKLA